MPLDIVPPVSPNDGADTCAPEVECLSATRISEIRGSAAKSPKAGVVCAKVEHYVERQRHPNRPRLGNRRGSVVIHAGPPKRGDTTAWIRKA
jgi:hypothetical protein